VVRKEDPIYALATPEGVSAISVIRISGLSISKKIF
jgi:Predicted GTPase